MKKILMSLFVLIAASTFFFSSAIAAPIYVGSWAPYNDSAPAWNIAADNNGNLAYTAQEAAALLFGGLASDYYISTIDSNPDNINNMAWYDVIGYGASAFAEDYFNKYLGLYYGPITGYTFGNINSPASAFIRDNFVSNLNYAFRVENTPVPEPSTALLLGLGLIGTALAGRKMRKAQM